MEDQSKEQGIDTWKEMEGTHRRGKIMGGLLVVAIGSLFLAKELGAAIPAWLFTWKMLLIAIGVVTAIKHKFRNPGWLVLVAVGGAFLFTDLYPEMSIKPFIWPVVIIMVGLAIIFKPRNKHWHQRHHAHMMRREWRRQCRHEHRHHRQHWDKHHQYHQQQQQNWQEYQEKYQGQDVFNDVRGDQTNEEYIDSTAIFAGVKKNVLSKSFKGGEITNVFGGTEINLMQADIQDTATLEVTQVFGGTKLIVPPHWEVIKSENVAIMGSIEDKRPIHPAAVNGEPSKKLILVGTTVFGGIEIRSY